MIFSPWFLNVNTLLYKYNIRKEKMQWEYNKYQAQSFPGTKNSVVSRR